LIGYVGGFAVFPVIFFKLFTGKRSWCFCQTVTFNAFEKNAREF
jgi:hypothetical protein